MAAKDSAETRKKIMDAAAALFARKGFNAVGVREIATRADVNISMISYYFGGKAGILHEIIDTCFDGYLAVTNAAHDEERPAEECLHSFVREAVAYVRANPDYAMVILGELPIESPEVTQLKAEKITLLEGVTRDFLSRLHLAPLNREQMSILAPAFTAMIISNFFMGPVIKNAFKVEFTDEFYDRYADAITTLFLSGIHGLAAARS